MSPRTVTRYCSEIYFCVVAKIVSKTEYEKLQYSTCAITLFEQCKYLNQISIKYQSIPPSINCYCRHCRKSVESCLALPALCKLRMMKTDDRLLSSPNPNPITLIPGTANDY